MSILCLEITKIWAYALLHFKREMCGMVPQLLLRTVHYLKNRLTSCFTHWGKYERITVIRFVTVVTFRPRPNVWKTIITSVRKWFIL